ncbi:hypothetical protein [Lentzea jiangxiensis]|uniref:LPXTG-motif cell wall anchor domain-containing protein n=1 Tax=Lentzea jiangxiensis TaxID=641025 RepID=A0A1H0NUR3_9PSEU|nr:hypothetical protein [Lentzea jiangxiensis]SDO96497.1 hypothetical protein SAMN05421507_104555 [Lentzea jiangxiensis]
MRENLNRTLSAALLTGGLLVATAGFAQAVPVPLDVDEEVRVGSLLSVPVEVCGNAVNVLGTGDATCRDKPAERVQADKALVSAPVTVCGNAVGVAGGGNGSCGDTGPKQANGSVEAPVTVCGTSAAVLGTASGDCGETGTPEQPQPEPEQPEQPEEPQPEPEQPGENPGDENPGNGTPGGDNSGSDNSGGGDTGDDSGAGAPQTGDKASQRASAVVPALSRTGADPLEFLLAGLGLMTAGVMARRGARRTGKA